VAHDAVHLYLSVGDLVQFAKTVGESDVYLFAGITGDFAPNHVNEQYMQSTSFGRRIAHGALLVGYMSACSTKMSALARSRGAENVPLSLGFDKIRFLHPVFLGDTVSCVYTITEIESQRLRAQAKITVTNQRDDLVAVATHILKWVRP
jgi:3-hydroxybutyryl-CoA dehydratase